MKIYLAGPLFTSAERSWNRALVDILREKHSVFLPQEIEPKRTGPEMVKEIFDLDVAGIDACDWVVAIMDQPDPDSGTCWEVGYAYAKGKPVLLVRTDFRTSGGEHGLVPFNIMMYASAMDTLVFPFATVGGTAHMILKWFEEHTS
jgi:nucleoside 2-deoxyribosyltransferase